MELTTTSASCPGYTRLPIAPAWLSQRPWQSTLQNACAQLRLVLAVGPGWDPGRCLDFVRELPSGTL
eukprot:2264400-Amphidinium_carterae.2